MNQWVEISFGTLLLIAGISIWGFNFAGFGTAATIFLKGGLLWLSLLFGFLMILLGISDLKA